MTSAELAGQLVKNQLMKMQQQQAESKRVMDRQTKRDVQLLLAKLFHSLIWLVT